MFPLAPQSRKSGIHLLLKLHHTLLLSAALCCSLLERVIRDVHQRMMACSSVLLSSKEHYIIDTWSIERLPVSVSYLHRTIPACIASLILNLPRFLLLTSRLLLSGSWLVNHACTRDFPRLLLLQQFALPVL